MDKKNENDLNNITENMDDEKNLSSEELIEKLRNEVAEQKQKTDEYFEHLKRNMAEFDNFKKRISKEKEMLYTTITSDLISDLLPIIDNLEKALNADSTDTSFKSGIEMIHTQIKEVLSKMGVEEIETINKEFDPILHEAVMHIEDETYGEKQIIEEFRKGYKIGDKIIRHSMVKVAN